MKKYHVHTTLSPRHREILDKYKEKYGTHQKVIEQALDRLDKGPKNVPLPSEKGEIQAQFDDKSGMMRLTLKEIMNIFIETADIDRFKTYTAERKPSEALVEYYCQKPLKECSLKEVMDTLATISQYAYWFDKVIYEDEDDRYMMKIYHSSGLNNSKVFEVIFGSLFKALEADYEIKISDRSLFIKVLKK
jgi:hypothetical protein